MKLIAGKMQLEAQLYGMQEQADDLKNRIAMMERQISYTAGRIDQAREEAQEQAKAEKKLAEEDAA